MTDEMNDALDRIFTNAEAIIENLGDKFTSQEFIRLASRAQQRAYIDLLAACRDQNYRRPIQQAHSYIGEHLRDLAVSLGYTYTREPSKEKSLFHTLTTRTTYTRRNEN